MIDHTYLVYNEDETVKDKITTTISFFDLQHGLNELAPRKREAMFYNVILDMKQVDVAAIMHITPVSVGQYVEQAMLKLAEHYFPEDLENE